MIRRPARAARVRSSRRPAGAQIALACSLSAAGVLAIALETASADAAPRALDLRPADRAPSTPGPSPRGHAFDVAQTNADCESCHAEIAAEWRGSLHRASQRDPAYTRQFAREPLAFCQSCHAPEAPADEAPSDAATELGTACITCHVAAGHILAAPEGRADARPAPHDIARTDDLAGARACAPCHEFSFPNATDRHEPLLMQSTITEHGVSGAGACADCHMPLVGDAKGRHRSHAFVASRDETIVRSSLDVVATRNEDRLVVRLEARGVGHAVPTGDLFRRIEVFAEIAGEDMQSLGARTTYLARHFTWGEGRDGKRVKVLARDDRPAPGAPVEVTLDLGAAASHHPIAWRVAYQRVDVPDEIDETRAGVEGEIVVASGTFPAPSPP